MLNQLLNQISKDFKQLKDAITDHYELYISAFTALLFTSRQTGYTRKELSTWNKADLLPYKISKSETKEEFKARIISSFWRRYSLIECVWIKVVVKLLRFGINEALIVDLKNQLFQQVDSIEKNDTELTPDEKKVKQLRESHFGKFLMYTTKYHIEFSILVAETGEFAIVNHASSSVLDIYKSFSDKTYVAINVTSLMKSFIGSDELSLDADYYVSILHPKEREVIQKIKQNAFKQVTLSLKDGSITHYYITKDREANELAVKNIARMLKKEDYQLIQCVRIDDSVVSYEEEALTSLV